MKKYSKDKNINQKVRNLIKSGWEAKAGSKHTVPEILNKHSIMPD